MPLVSRYRRDSLVSISKFAIEPTPVCFRSLGFCLCFMSISLSYTRSGASASLVLARWLSVLAAYGSNTHTLIWIILFTWRYRSYCCCCAIRHLNWVRPVNHFHNQCQLPDDMVELPTIRNVLLIASVHKLAALLWHHALFNRGVMAYITYIDIMGSPMVRILCDGQYLYHLLLRYYLLTASMQLV